MLKSLEKFRKLDMNNPSHIALFGGSGRTGKEIILQALNQGYHVTTLVRDTDSIEFTNPALTVIKGSPMIEEDVKMTLSNTDTVMVALNVSRSSNFPWAKIITPPEIFKVALRNIIDNMKMKYIERIITISAWGVHDSYPEATHMKKLMIKYSKLGVTYQAHEEQERKLRESNLQWTAVRPVNLKSYKYHKDLIIRHKNKEKLNSTVGRKDVARFMLEIISNPDYYRQTPAISNQ